MRLVVLGSGSEGNSALLEIGSMRLLIDAGLSARTLAARLEAVGVEPHCVDGILLSHEHSDHARGAERFSRKHKVPLLCAAETLEALDASPAHFAGWSPLPETGPLDLGAVRIDAFPVPHDAVKPLGFVVEGEGLRVGFATDLGHATTLVLERLRGCHVLLIESNHDPEMLRNGPYPWHLKQRISGRMGHLSNVEAGAFLESALDERCQAIVLAHLSSKNNTPQLARQAAERGMRAARLTRVAVRVAAPKAPTPPIEL